MSLAGKSFRRALLGASTRVQHRRVSIHKHSSGPGTDSNTLVLPELRGNQYWKDLQPVVHLDQVAQSKRPRRSDTDPSINAKSLTFFDLPGQGKFQGKTRYDAVFLRDMCTCHRCRDPDSTQKKFATQEIPEDITISKVRIEGENLCLDWTNDIPNFQNHTTSLSLKDLRKYAHTTAHVATSTGITQPMIEWNASRMSKTFENRWNVATYDAFTQDKQSFQRIIDQIWTSGLTFITEVPRDEQSVVKLAETIGPIRDTFYGRTWDVKDKPKAENVAYTSHYLGLHMDLLYMKQPPGLQLLHCLDSSSVGGQSIFADSLMAARDLHTHSPHFFDILAKFPVTYNYRNGEHWYRDHKPVFEIDYNQIQATSSSSFINFERGVMPPLLNINWSPQFQGDFTIDTGSRDHAARLRLWIKAAKEFDERLNAKRNLFRHRLGPGQCVIFNNRRVVHGREAFESGSGARWLKGTYVDTDVLESRMRKVVREHEPPAESRIPNKPVVPWGVWTKAQDPMEAGDPYYMSHDGNLVPKAKTS